MRWPRPTLTTPSSFAPGPRAYLDKLEALDREVREAVAKIPPERRKVISTHDAFGYFAAEYGVQFVAPLGSPRNRAQRAGHRRHYSQIKAQKIPAVFLENISESG